MWLAWSARRSYWDSFSKNWVGLINRSALVMGWCLGFCFSESRPGLGFRPSGSSRGVRLVPVVNRQRVQKALDLISCPVVGNIHGGRLRHTKSARKGRTVTDLHERRQRPDTQKWQSWAQTLPPPPTTRRPVSVLAPLTPNCRRRTARAAAGGMVGKTSPDQ